MKVQTRDFVQLSYTSRLEDGTILDSSADTNKFLEFTVGTREVSEVFENSVLGREKDEEFSIKLNPQEAFGDFSDEKVVKLPLDQIPKDYEPKLDSQIVLEHSNGTTTEEVVGIVKLVTPTHIVIDLNPPLSGKIVNITLKVLNIQRK